MYNTRQERIPSKFHLPFEFQSRRREANSHSFLEMHNKSVVSAIGILLSIGGWFLWNIILSSIYTHNVTYNVKGGLLQRFGDNLLWWLSLILIVSICLLFEVIIRAAKVAYLPSDVSFRISTPWIMLTCCV
jgi:magnesium-transporting ATPase (P-type)